MAGASESGVLLLFLWQRARQCNEERVVDSFRTLFICIKGFHYEILMHVHNVFRSYLYTPLPSLAPLSPAVHFLFSPEPPLLLSGIFFKDPVNPMRGACLQE